MVAAKVNVSCWVSQGRAEALRELARSKKQNVSETMRDMIDEFICRHEQEEGQNESIWTA